MSSSILVTGGSGFIGSHLIDLLIDRGHSVLNVDLLTYAGNLAWNAAHAQNPRYAFLRGDIADPLVVRRAIAQAQPDAIIHLAAETHVDRSIAAAQPFIETNVRGTYVLLEAARDYWQTRRDELVGSRFRFLHVSTDEVFGTLGTSGSFTEESPYAPRSPYAASKAAGDHLVRAWHATYGLPTLIAHPANNYGVRQYPEKLIPLVIERCLNRQAIPVYGDGQQVRDWLHVSDHCRALLCILENGRVGESYNVSANDERSNLELVQQLTALVDAEFHRLHPEAAPLESAQRITHVTDRLGHDFRYALDSSKLRNQLAWQPKIDFLIGLTQTVKLTLQPNPS